MHLHCSSWITNVTIPLILANKDGWLYRNLKKIKHTHITQIDRQNLIHELFWLSTHLSICCNRNCPIHCDPVKQCSRCMWVFRDFLNLLHNRFRRALWMNNLNRFQIYRNTDTHAKYWHIPTNLHASLHDIWFYNSCVQNMRECRRGTETHRHVILSLTFYWYV